MDRSTLAGVLLTLAGFTGYVAGVLAPYPFRAFSIAGVMAGLTLTLVTESEAGR